VPRLDPRTNEPKAIKAIEFKELWGGVEEARWAAKLLPIYRMRIKKEDQIDKFFEKRPDLDYKVILFSNKKRTWTVFKGLTAEFKDRLDFGEVYQSSKSILSHFKIKKLPSIVVYKRLGYGEGQL